MHLLTRLRASVTLFFAFNFAIGMVESNASLKLEGSVDKVDSLIALCWNQRNTAPEQSVEVGLMALEMAKSIEYEEGMMKSNSFIAVAYRNIGKYDQALVYYTEGYDLALAKGNLLEQGFSNINFANLFLYLQQPKKTYNYLDRALEISEQVAAPYMTAYIYLNMGRAQLMEEKYKEAIENLEVALKIRKTLGNLNNVSGCIKYIGDAYLGLGNFKEALDRYEEAEAIFDLSHDKHLYCHLLLNKSKTLLAMNKKPEATTILKKALKIGQEINSWPILEQSNEQFYQLSDDEGDIASALNFLAISTKYKDSIYNEGLQNQINSFDFFIKRKDYEYAQRIKSIKQNQIKHGSFIAIFLLLIILLFTYLAYRAIQNKNKLLADQNLKIIELSKLKEDITTMIAHDLKNPINTILGLSSSPDLPSAKDYIKKACQNMQSLISNMLDLNKMESQKMQIQKESLDVHELIDFVLDQLHFQINQKSHNIKIQIEEQLRVQGDFHYLERILTNLISNAVKYTQPGGDIGILINNGKKHVQFTITDTGYGIPEKYLDKIFDKFWKSEMNSEMASSGLGLTFCKLAVEAHGGKIGVSSIENQGTTIWFSIPSSSEELAQRTLPRVEHTKKKDPALFQKKDRQLLAAIISKLQEIDVYEVTKIMIILQEASVDFGKSKWLENWHDQLVEAYKTGNEELYTSLLSVLDDDLVVLS